MDMTIDQFYSSGGTTSFIDRFSAMLNIPSYRVPIAQVSLGSVILDIMILPNGSASFTGTATTNAQSTELQKILQTVNHKYTSGEIESILNIVLMNFKANAIIVVTNSDSQSSNGKSDNGSGGINDSNDNGGISSSPIIDTPSGLNQCKKRTDSTSFNVVI